MALARQLNPSRVSAKKSLDVIEVLVYCGLVSFAFVNLVPLIVVVEDQRDDPIEIYDEAILRRVVDQPVEPFVEIGEVMIVRTDASQ